MYRVALPNVTAHRTCTPLHEKHQATPYATFLDPAETGNVYSGMVAYRTGPDTVAIMDGAQAAEVPFGLFALDHNTVIDDLNGLGINLMTVWIGAADAFFTLTSSSSGGAFDTTQSYTVPTTGARQKLYCGTGSAKGQLTPVQTASSPAVAELINVLSSTQIIVRLLPPGVTA